MSVSSEQILQFLQQNPGMSDADIVYNMQQYGISPDQVIQATGMSPADAMQRFSAGAEQIGMPMTGLAGSEQAAQRGLSDFRSDVGQGMGAAGSALAGAQNTAMAGFSPYMQGGEAAMSSLRALTGADGQQAFDQAYTDSPYMRFLQEQGQRAVMGNQAAMGGLGGGNVQKELTRFGQGLAGQGLQQQIGNLQNLSGMGLQAAGQMGSIGANLGQSQANTLMQGGLATGQAAMGVNQGIGQNRMNVGNMLAGQQAGVSQQLANLALQQGQGMSDIYGTGAGNLANLLSGYGQGSAQIGMQGAGQFAGMGAIPGTQQNPGILGQLGQLAGGVGGLIGAVRQQPGSTLGGL